MSTIHFGHLKGSVPVDVLLVERGDERLIDLRHDGVRCRGAARHM